MDRSCFVGFFFTPVGASFVCFQQSRYIVLFFNLFEVFLFARRVHLSFVNVWKLYRHDHLYFFFRFVKYFRLFLYFFSSIFYRQSCCEFYSMWMYLDVCGCMYVCVIFSYLFFSHIFCALPIFTFKIWFDSNHNSHHSIQFYRNAFKTMQNYLSAHFVCMYSSFVPLNLILTVCSINTLQCSMFDIHIDLILNDKNEINGERIKLENRSEAHLFNEILYRNRILCIRSDRRVTHNLNRTLVFIDSWNDMLL